MIRPTLLIALCLMLLPVSAMARQAGPSQVGKPSQARDLAQIRSSKVLRVLVNQSRNSSGQVQGESVGVEYHRLRAFERYLNGHARDGHRHAGAPPRNTRTIELHLRLVHARRRAADDLDPWQ